MRARSGSPRLSPGFCRSPGRTPDRPEHPVRWSRQAARRHARLFRSAPGARNRDPISHRPALPSPWQSRLAIHWPPTRRRRPTTTDWSSGSGKTRANGLDSPDRPHEPVAQVRVLPAATAGRPVMSRVPAPPTLDGLTPAEFKRKCTIEQQPRITSRPDQSLGPRHAAWCPGRPGSLEPSKLSTGLTPAYLTIKIW
jgi:hypothetical protein